MKLVMGLALLSALIFVACSGGGAEQDAPSATATETQPPTTTPEPTATPRPVPTMVVAAICWDIWGEINVQNRGDALLDWQLVTVIRACQTSASWNLVLNSDFVTAELKFPPSKEDIIRVCKADAEVSRRISHLSICTDLVGG